MARVSARIAAPNLTQRPEQPLEMPQAIPVAAALQPHRDTGPHPPRRSAVARPRSKPLSHVAPALIWLQIRRYPPPQPASVTPPVTNLQAAAEDHARHPHSAPYIPRPGTAVVLPSPRSHAGRATRVDPHRTSTPLVDPGRSRVPAPAAPPVEHRRRICNSPHSRTAARQRTEKTSPCSPYARAATCFQSRAALPSAQAYRTRRAGIRGMPPAESESSRTGSPRSAGHTRASSVAIAEFCHLLFSEAAAAPATRPRETSPQTARSTPIAASPDPLPPPAPSAAPPHSAAHRRPGTAAHIHPRSTSTPPPDRHSRESSPSPPSPTEHESCCQTASARKSANSPTRPERARSRRCGHPEQLWLQVPGPPDS